MTARKIRPQRGEPVTPDMSMRDMAAALGISTADISRWKRLAKVPDEDFEAILASTKDAPGRRGALMTAQRIIDLSQGWDRSRARPARCCPHCGKPL